MNAQNSSARAFSTPSGCSDWMASAVTARAAMAPNVSA
jgi:hypothetical protein